jgi:hypothetical protein
MKDWQGPGYATLPMIIPHLPKPFSEILIPAYRRSGPAAADPRQFDKKVA